MGPALEPDIWDGGCLPAWGEEPWLSLGSKRKQTPPGEGGLRSQGLLAAVPLRREGTHPHPLELQRNRIHISWSPTWSS